MHAASSSSSSAAPSFSSPSSARAAAPSSHAAQGGRYCQQVTAVHNRQISPPLTGDVRHHDMQSWLTHGHYAPTSAEAAWRPSTASVATFNLAPEQRTLIDKNILFIWVGGNKIAQKNLNNIKVCAEKNPDARITVLLHDTRSSSTPQLIAKSGFAEVLPRNITCVDLGRSPALESIRQSDVWPVSETLMQESRFSLVSDLMRFAYNRVESLMYVDVDDAITSPIDWTRASAAPDEILVSSPASLKESPLFIPTRPYLAHKDNKIIEQVSKEQLANFNQLLKIDAHGYGGMGLSALQSLMDIEVTCGAICFTEVFRRCDPRIDTVLKRVEQAVTENKGELALDAHTVSLFPFAPNIQICDYQAGADNSCADTFNYDLKGVQPPPATDTPHLAWLVENIRRTSTWSDARFDVVPLLLNQMLAESPYIAFDRLVIVDNQGALTHFSAGPPDLQNAVVLRLDNADGAAPHYDAVSPRDPRGYQLTQRNGRWMLAPDSIRITPIARDGLCLTNALASSLSMGGERLRAEFSQWLTQHDDMQQFEEQLAIASAVSGPTVAAEMRSESRPLTRHRAPALIDREVAARVAPISAPIVPSSTATPNTPLSAPQLAAITEHLVALIDTHRLTDLLASLTATTALPAPQQREVALAILPALVQQMDKQDTRRHPGGANVAAVSHLLDVLTNTQALAADQGDAQLASLLFTPQQNGKHVAETLAPWLPFPDVKRVGEQLLHLTHSLASFKPAQAAIQTGIERVRKRLKQQVVGDDNVKQALSASFKAVVKAVKRGQAATLRRVPPALPLTDALPRLMAAGEAHVKREARQKQVLQAQQAVVNTPAYQRQEQIFARLRSEAEDKQARHQQHSQAMLSYSLSKTDEANVAAAVRKVAKQTAEVANVQARVRDEARVQQRRQALLAESRAQGAATVQQMLAIDAARRAPEPQRALTQHADHTPQASLTAAESARALTAPPASSALMPYDARAKLGVAVKTVTGRYIPALLTLSGKNVVIESDAARAAPGIHTFTQIKNAAAEGSQMWLNGPDGGKIKVSGELDRVALQTRAGHIDLRAQAWQGNTAVLASDKGMLRTRLDQTATAINARDMAAFNREKEQKNVQRVREARAHLQQASQAAAAFAQPRTVANPPAPAAPRQFAADIKTAAPVSKRSAGNRDSKVGNAVNTPYPPSRRPSPVFAPFTPLTLRELLARAEAQPGSQAQQ